MSAPVPATAERERLRTLMIGFSTGRLSEIELRELLAMLQDQQFSSFYAAQAWEVLDTAAGLRAVHPELFLDQVVLRLGDDGADVARAVVSRIGHSRPRLQPVAAPAPRSRRWLRWSLISAPVLSALVLLGVWWSQQRQPMVLVEQVSGLAMLDDLTLVAGHRFKHGYIDMQAAGAQLVLRLPRGDRFALHGPALKVVCGPGQWSVNSGHVELSAQSPLLVAWHGGTLHLSAGDAAAITVVPSGATIAVMAGAPRCHALGRAAQTLSATSAASWFAAQ